MEVKRISGSCNSIKCFMKQFFQWRTLIRFLILSVVNGIRLPGRSTLVSLINRVDWIFYKVFGRMSKNIPRIISFHVGDKSSPRQAEIGTICIGYRCSELDQSNVICLFRITCKKVLFVMFSLKHVPWALSTYKLKKPFFDYFRFSFSMRLKTLMLPIQIEEILYVGVWASYITYSTRTWETHWR